MSVLKYIICSLALGTLFSGELVRGFKFLKKKFFTPKKFRYFKGEVFNSPILLRFDGKKYFYFRFSHEWVEWVLGTFTLNLKKITRKQARQEFPKAFRKNS